MSSATMIVTVAAVRRRHSHMVLHSAPFQHTPHHVYIALASPLAPQRPAAARLPVLLPACTAPAVHHTHTGVTDKRYVEFGVESGQECVTHYLREKSGFTGLMMDGSNENPGINLWREYFRAENIVSLFQKHDVPHPTFDVLSIDIDLNTWCVCCIVCASCCGCSACCACWGPVVAACVRACVRAE